MFQPILTLFSGTAQNNLRFLETPHAKSRQVAAPLWFSELRIRVRPLSGAEPEAP
jgi:hypothetical protein